jgi:hypothetical protein
MRILTKPRAHTNKTLCACRGGGGGGYGGDGGGYGGGGGGYGGLSVCVYVCVCCMWATVICVYVCVCVCVQVLCAGVRWCPESASIHL